MADTIKSVADLLTLFADNTSGAISPQDLRDFLVSALGVYGDLRVEAGSAAQTSIDTTPVKLTGFNANGLGNGITPDHVTDNDLSVLTTRVVEVSFACTFLGTASQTFYFEIYKNGASTGIRGRADINATPDVAHVSCGGLVSCTAADNIEVYVYSAAGSGHSVTPYEAQLVARGVA